MARCVIFGAGPIQDDQITRSFLQQDDFILCADGGYAHAHKMGLRPDLLIGDFDSMRPPEHAGCEVCAYPPEKDDTDMLAAIKLGLQEGYRSFRLYGGSGGRLEHTLANIQCLLYLKEHDAIGYMMDGTGMILVAKEEEISFRENLEGYLSLFSLGERATVSIEHMKYLLDHAELTNSFPIGISNEFIGEMGCVRVHQGAVVIIISWVN